MTSWKEHKEHAAAEKEAKPAKEVQPPPLEVWVARVEMDGHQRNVNEFSSKAEAAAFAKDVLSGNGFVVETPTATHYYPSTRVTAVSVEKKAKPEATP